MTDTAFAQQLMMSNLSMTSQIMQGTFSAISNIGNLQNSTNSSGVNSIANYTVTNSLGKLAYAVEGDSKYNEEIDTNGDGIITYNEYVKYISDTISSKFNLPENPSTTFKLDTDSQTGLLTFSVTNMTKILTSYLNNSVQLPSSFIETEI